MTQQETAKRFLSYAEIFKEKCLAWLKDPEDKILYSEVDNAYIKIESIMTSEENINQILEKVPQAILRPYAELFNTYQDSYLTDGTNSADARAMHNLRNAVQKCETVQIATV